VGIFNTSQIIFILSLVLALFIGYIVLLVALFKEIKKAIMILSKKHDNISNLKPGMKIRVKGKVISKNTISSFVTKEPCAWYSIDVQRKNRSTTYYGWHTEKSNESSKLIEIEDTSGSVFLSPKMDYRLMEPTFHYWNPNTKVKDLKEAVIAAKNIFLNQEELPKDPFKEGHFIKVLGNEREASRATFRYCERFLTEGDKVICQGYVTEIDGKKIISNNDSIKSFVISPNKTNTMIIWARIILFGALSIIGFLFFALVFYWLYNLI